MPAPTASTSPGPIRAAASSRSTSPSSRASGWQSLGSLALGGAIVATTGASINPSIALGANGEPVVAWTVLDGSASDIFVAQYNPAANGGAGGWDSLGDSLAAGGISGTGAADDAQVVNTSSGLVVAYRDRSSGVDNVYVKQFDGGQWVALGSGAASGAGISQSSTGVQGLTIATDGGDVAVAWTQTVGSTSQVYMLEYNSGTWSQLGGSATGNGLSNSTGQALAPTLAFDDGSLFAAWQDNSSGAFEIYAATWNGTAWAAAGTSADSGGGVSNTEGMASDPKLASNDGQLYLLWLDNLISNPTSNSVAVYVKQWNGSAFVEDVVGDASYRGIGGSIGARTAPALAVDPSGNPFAAWEDFSAGAPQIYVRGNTVQLATTQPFHYVNGPSTAGDAFSTAPGAATNDGLSPATPKDSIPDIAGDLAPGDVLYLDAGNYAGFTLGFGRRRRTGAGLARRPSRNLRTGRARRGLESHPGKHHLRRRHHPHRLHGCRTHRRHDQCRDHNRRRFERSDRPRCHHRRVGRRHHADRRPVRGWGSRYRHRVRPDRRRIAGDRRHRGRRDRHAGALQRDQRRRTGIDLADPAGGQIVGNTVGAVDTVLLLDATFTGSIADNDFYGAAVGVSYQAGGSLRANRIHDNVIGVLSTVDDPSTGLGFIAGQEPNQIYQNTTGVELVNATMQDQHVYA